MGQKAKADEVNFNYPIPRELHHAVRVFSAEHGIPVKDVVINALTFYLDNIMMMDDEEEEL